MSVDMYLLILDDGPAIDIEIIERAFEGLVDQSAAHLSLLDADGKPGMTSIDFDTSGISVNRPPDYEESPQFWNAIFEVLRQTHTFFIWPSSGERPQYCIAHPDFVANVPPLLIERLGEPAIVSSGAEIVAAIAGE